MLPALYKLSSEYHEAAGRLVELDLDPQTITDTLDGLKGTIEVKAQHVAIIIRNIDFLAEATTAAARELQAKAKAAEARSDSLREYLRVHLIACGIKSIEPTPEMPYFKVALQANPPTVEVLDEAAIPEDYKRAPEPPPPPNPLPDKKLILQALKDGYAVPGCRIKHSQRLVIK